MKTLAVFSVLISFLALGSCLTQEECDVVVQLHNDFRSQLVHGKTLLGKDKYAQPAKNIYKTVYNTSVEAIAEKWANTCPGLNHNNNNGGHGENIFVSSGGSTKAGIFGLLEGRLLGDLVKSASNSWWGEFAQYGENTIYYKDGKAYINNDNWFNVGHATQMAWPGTTQIGCAVKTGCSGKWPNIVVCNYYPPGNMNIKTGPFYEVGQACSADNQCTLYGNSKCEASSGLCLTGGQSPLATPKPEVTQAPVTKPKVTTTTAPPTLCKDNLEIKNCIARVKRGECTGTKNKNYTRKNCKKTCKLC